MAFDAVVFGSYVIGTGFTDGDSIPSSGYYCFIVPTYEVGSEAFDVSIDYVDQDGNSDSTTVSTAVSAYTQAGTHIKMVLNNGDSGVRDITGVTVVGGTAGDEFTLESWNEGLGGHIALESSAIDQPDSNTGKIGARDFSTSLLLENESTNALIFSENVTTSNVTYDGSKFVLETEEIEPSYEGMDEDDGFLECNVTKSNANHFIQLYLKSEQSYEQINSDYQSHTFECEVGGYSIEFDYDVQLNSSYFILELLDSDGTVKWTKNGTTSGSNQVIAMVTDGFYFRVRCTADYTTPVGYTDYAEVSNITISRYKTSGYIEQTVWKYREFMKDLRLISLGGTIVADTAIKAHVDVSDTLSGTTGFVGPDGTASTYYDAENGHIYTGAYVGKYWKTKVFLTSNGKYTPEFNFIKYMFDLWLNLNLIEWEPAIPNTSHMPPVAFHPLVFCSSDEDQPYSQPNLTCNNYVHRLIEYISSAINQTQNDSGLVGLTHGRIAYEELDANDFVYGCDTDGVVYNNNTFEMVPEEVEPNYSSEIDEDSGFLDCTHSIDVGNKTLKIDLNPETFYDCTDSEYQRQSFIWNESGFTSIEFDYDVVLHSTYFILELVDGNGTVKWSKNSTASDTGQVVAMTTDKWEFRVRCKADYTSPVAPWDNHAYVSNIKITRYPLTGYIEQPWFMNKKNITELRIFELTHTLGTAGTAIKAQIDVSDDGETSSGWIGPGGTSASYFTGGSELIDTGSYAGKYYKLKIFFESDGRYGPVFHEIRVLQFIDLYLREILLQSSWSESAVGTVMSGYVKDQNDDIILNAIKVILESTYVFGRDTMGTVNPETGFYQVFVKEAKYDKRHLIIQVAGKTTNISLSAFGNPEYLDATLEDIPNQDLHFWKAPLCKSVAHVDSLVTY